MSNVGGRPAIGPKLQIRLRPEQLQKLDELAARETERLGVVVTRASLIRSAVEDYLAAERGTP